MSGWGLPCSVTWTISTGNQIVAPIYLRTTSLLHIGIDQIVSNSTIEAQKHFLRGIFNYFAVHFIREVNPRISLRGRDIRPQVDISSNRNVCLEP